MRQRGRSALGKTVAAENRTFLLPAALQLPHPSRLFSTSPQSKSRPANTSQALPSARQGRTAPFLALLSGQSLRSCVCPRVDPRISIPSPPTHHIFSNHTSWRTLHRHCPSSRTIRLLPPFKMHTGRSQSAGRLSDCPTQERWITSPERCRRKFCCPITCLRVSARI